VALEEMVVLAALAALQGMAALEVKTHVAPAQEGTLVETPEE
jgi:hypothetical protein